MVFGMDDFEAEHDLAIIKEAEDIKRNPQRMSRAQRLAEQKAAELKELSGGTDEERDLGFRRIR